MTVRNLQASQIEQFQNAGFLVMPGVLSADLCAQVRHAITTDLASRQGPAEFEADVGYPGAPTDRDGAGGDTPRRLLQAYARNDSLKSIAQHPALAAWLKVLLDSTQPMLSQSHHNCVMTKHPGYSSATLWHQDIRYWSFARPELISAWFALGPEDETNGALQVIPASHKHSIDRSRLDSALFLRPELAANRSMIESAQVVNLNPGDLLLFHCRLFHAAGQNRSQRVKVSPVFTYHAEDNYPIPGTRSEQFPSIGL